MTYYIDLQHEKPDQLPVTDDDIIRWASLALRDELDSAELTIRLTDPEEIKGLNHQYRQQNKPTNVLAFPSNLPKSIQLELPLLGDIIICPQVLNEESKTLNQPLKAHWAHIVIHGVLHLLGYDHIEDDEAEAMQAIEIKLLAELGYDNPYDTEESVHE